MIRNLKSLQVNERELDQDYVKVASTLQTGHTSLT